MAARAHEPAVEGLAKVVPARRGRQNRLVNDLGEDVRGRRGLPVGFARQQTEGDHRQRPEIGGRADGIAPHRLLGRHVKGRAEDRPRRGGRRALVIGRRRVVEQLGDAEVEHLDEGRAVVARGEQQVLGLQIAVHHARRVRPIERQRRLPQPLDHQRRGLRFRAGNGPQIAALQEFHHQEGGAVELVGHVGVDHPHHVLALQTHPDARLAPETLDGAPVEPGVSVQKLERQKLARAPVFDHEDRTHTPRAEVPNRSILAPQAGRHLRRSRHGAVEGRDLSLTRRSTPGAVS
ncbi:MAG: hypothetical protein MUF34_17765 [Polyangiaceae bacterium]|nr:hypothetical protein [Polyangiaceae bacterium]